MTRALRALPSLLALLAGCATSVRRDADPATDAGATPTPGLGGSGGGVTSPQEVYGHSENALYRVDVVTKAVTRVGLFSGCTYVADIAIDADGNLYASTGTELHVIETNTARCSRVASGKFPNSLSFVAAGVLDAVEVLVGYQGGDYVRIDPASGKVTKVGELGGGFESSGDLVSATGGVTYLTVKGPGCADCLVEIDPKTGVLRNNLGPLGKSDVFGVGFWAGVVYGFTHAGEIFEVDISVAPLTTRAIAIPNRPPDLKFWGAGSTTTAPISPVK